MAQTIRISLPTINALTNTDPNNFALYADATVDYILIKEKSRGSSSFTGTSNIAHGLGYIPLCFVFTEISSNVYRKLFSSPFDGIGYWFEVNATNLVLRNSTGLSKVFQYYIFYDIVL